MMRHPSPPQKKKCQNSPLIEESVKIKLNQRRTLNLKLEHPQKQEKEPNHYSKQRLDTALLSLAVTICNFSEGSFLF